MDSTAVLTVVSGMLLLSMIILTSFCLYCKGSSQQKQIMQHHDPHDIQPGPGPRFTVIRPYTEPISNTLSFVDHPNFITSPSMHETRRQSPCPSQSESLSNYVNDDGNGYEQPPDSDKNENNDYLDVLPDDVRVSQPSLASSANSGQNYENIGQENKSNEDEDEDDEDSDSARYINLQDNMDTPSYTLQVGSLGSCSSGDQDYVNAPKQSYHL